MCDRINFKICRPLTFEFARRYYCDSERILAFLIRHEELFHRDPRLIWNTDETKLNSLEWFRVLSQDGMLPLTNTMQQLPHITWLISINADGVILGPIIVLKSLQTLGDLQNLQSYYYFATSINGWLKDFRLILYLCSRHRSVIVNWRFHRKYETATRYWLLMVTKPGSIWRQH
jgi:hypothetical protein